MPARVRVVLAMIAFALFAILLAEGFDRLDEEDACRARGLVLRCDPACACALAEAHYGRP